MQFHYKAIGPDNRLIEADLEAESSADVLAFLTGNSLRPVAISQSSSFKKRFFSAKVAIIDQVFITKYLSLMLGVGTDLFTAIDILISDFDKPSVKAILIEMRNNLAKGRPFHVTFDNYPKVFSPVFVNMVRAGEVSGNLQRVFSDLSNKLEREQSLRSRIKGALIYPVILMGVSLIILILLVSFALPKIAPVFCSGNCEPPHFSKIVFSIGLFFGQYVWFILGALVLVGVSIWFSLTRFVVFRKFLFKLFSKLPIIKTVVSRIAIQRFATTLASLMKSGLPILDSLDITAKAVGNDELREAIERISKEGISKGLTIGEAFKKEPAFPRIVVNLIGIAEKSGHIEEILDTLSDFYETEIDTSLKGLVSLLEPVMLFGIGIVVAVIALSIIVPIYQLVGQF